MGLNETVSAERLHIGFFGMRNAGKSSLVNAVTNQKLSLVSDTPGTTTDPVRKAMELLPLGPVVILDTPGIDDEGELGLMRVERAKRELARTDVAVLVVDAVRGMTDWDRALLDSFNERKIPHIIAYNKAELVKKRQALQKGSIYVSAKTGEGVDDLRGLLGELGGGVKKEKPILRDLLTAGDIVVLVTPIDEAAPKGRIILPQQMVLRDILDAHAAAFVCQDTELRSTLEALRDPPRMVICDSQVFGKVAKDTPKDVPLTSFSILMARYKGELGKLISGAAALKNLRDGDKVLISEGCTHHRQCKDIGTVKMPGWIEEFSGAKPEYIFSSGAEFPDDLGGVKLVVHCGGCMLNEAEMKHRAGLAAKQGVPMVNYGVAIAAMHGILERSLELFPEALEMMDK